MKVFCQKKFVGFCVPMIVCILVGSTLVIGSDVERPLSQSITTRRAIMLTGFWDPTGRMLAPFSTDPLLNPGGWQGENWENYGFDVYSYFPTPGSYTGMFEVDYQDTWEDFWSVTADLEPIAIISFGAGTGPWEIEYNARNLESWVWDENPPNQPTPCPPDDTVPGGYIRHATLPLQGIADAVNAEGIVDAWVDWEGNPGAYLCEYIAYLGMWYQAMHNTSYQTNPCRCAGFIHVNSAVPVSDAMLAVNITLRTTLEYLLQINNPPDRPVITGKTSGKAGESYTYTIVTQDPDHDDVLYYVEWYEDCPAITWEGPFVSGVNITKSNVWEEQGVYTIGAKAKDIYGAESDWTFLEVEMPYVKTRNPFFILFFERLVERFPFLWNIMERIG